MYSKFYNNQIIYYICPDIHSLVLKSSLNNNYRKFKNLCKEFQLFLSEIEILLIIDAQLLELVIYILSSLTTICLFLKIINNIR